jgi:hypothetical protein
MSITFISHEENVAAKELRAEICAAVKRATGRDQGGRSERGGRAHRWPHRAHRHRPYIKAFYHPPAGAPNLGVAGGNAAVPDAATARCYCETGGPAVTYQIW